MAVDNWTREQTIVALNLYCKIPFNRVSSNHPDIIRIAKIIGRTPNSVKMKIGNFGSFDPELKKRGIVGLGNTSKLDNIVWNEFNSDWDNLAYESELLISKFTNQPIEKVAEINIEDIPLGKEREAIIKQRVNQSFFRSTILSSYNIKCCITGLSIPDFLVASHIIPWSKDDKNRLNPHNGLCLNSIHDKAFDKGFITITTDYRIKVSKYFNDFKKDNAVSDLFLKYDNQSIILPDKFSPTKEFLEYHHKNIFKK
ncbi:MAG TPA: HNH endonuclease [Chitinophagales bacterium]|nr:HNH endonuclease [Chitinophagales bacterium]